MCTILNFKIAFIFNVFLRLMKSECGEKCFIIIKHCAPDNQAILETQNCLKLDQTHQRDWFLQKYCGLLREG